MQNHTSHAILIADLGYGDAGKGSTVDALARSTQAHTVVRYNGGAQAAHNVVTPEGRHHTFAQFGSAAFIPGVRTHLSRYMLLHPLAMLSEERHLRALGVRDAFARTSIERGALVVTPFQQAANRLREMARGDARHGSCGMGIGETMADSLANGENALFAGDLADRDVVLRKLAWLRDAKIAQLEGLLAGLPRTPEVEAERGVLYDPGIIAATADVYQHFAAQIQLVEPGYLGSLLNRPGAVIFEGAQGVLLDEWWGFFPYNSWSTLTFRNADRLLEENHFEGEAYKLGLIRAYATRHGAGPFVSEDARLTQAIPDRHNQNNAWQRQFRVGYLDLVALRYALRVVGRVDGLAVTNLDRMAEIPEWQMCIAHSHGGMAPSGGADPGVEPFFKCSGGLCTDIRLPADPTDLPRMEQLTRLLMEMQPVYHACPQQPAEYAAHIGAQLGLPIAMTSYGPTALEKTFSTEMAFSALPVLSAQRIPLQPASIT